MCVEGHRDHVGAVRRNQRGDAAAADQDFLSPRGSHKIARQAHEGGRAGQRRRRKPGGVINGDIADRSRSVSGDRIVGEGAALRLDTLEAGCDDGGDVIGAAIF